MGDALFVQVFIRCVVKKCVLYMPKNLLRKMGFDWVVTLGQSFSFIVELHGGRLCSLMKFVSIQISSAIVLCSGMPTHPPTWQSLVLEDSVIGTLSAPPDPCATFTVCCND